MTSRKQRSLKTERRKIMRLADYNYSQSGFYFVTICTNNHKCHFGNITETQDFLSLPRTNLSEIGKIAKKCWLEILEHFPETKLDEFTIMPNHIHGIIEIIDSRIVGHRHACALQYTERQYQKLPVIIGSFKSAVTKQINQTGNQTSFAWQKSYYDHVIRNEESLQKIREYIINNSAKWQEDIENQKFFMSLNKKELERERKEHYKNLF